MSLNQEFVQLAQEATRTLGGTQFNGQNILATTDELDFQIGANNNTTIDQITVAAFDWTGNSGITTVLGSTIITGTDAPGDADHRHRQRPGRAGGDRHRHQRHQQPARHLRRGCRTASRTSSAT